MLRLLVLILGITLGLSAAEVPVAPPALGPADGGNSRSAPIAVKGDGYLVVWEERTFGSSEIASRSLTTSPFTRPRPPQ
jgi:hypothetical protein